MSGVFLYLSFGLIEWQEINKNTNWGVILLFGAANIRDPIIKKTVSLIKDDATPSAVSMSRITCIIIINIATAGNGIDSLIIKVSVTSTIIKVLWPSGDKPSGVGT